MKVEQLNSFSELEIVAASLPNGGVFQSPGYLKAFSDNFSNKNQLILLAVKEGEEIKGYGVFEAWEKKAMFLGMKPVLGKEEVTDFGDMVYLQGEGKRVWQVTVEWLKNNGYQELQLDYVREDGESMEFLKNQGEARQQEVSPYIDLPKSFEGYLEKMQRKHRKELKRKIKRLEEKRNYYECSEKTLERDFEEFVRLHRLSDPEKRKFMSEKMKRFFYQVKTTKLSGWQSKLCFLKINNRPVAGVMTFENEREVWLYNSGYDPKYQYYSVGLLLKSYKIKKAIEEGKKKYDFLRGSERYKYELGAKEMKLWQIKLLLE